MTNIKHTAIWALTGIVIGLFAFAVNYWLYPVSLPGYELFAGPAMIALSFFSEETPFWPKLSVFIIGQYLTYFMVIALAKKLTRFFRQ